MTVGSASRAIGEVLRDLREARGWTQADLAARSGVSLAAIRDLEQGRTHRPRREPALALVRALEPPAEQANVLLARLSAARTTGQTAASPAAAVRIDVLGPLLVSRDHLPVDVPRDAAIVLHRLGLTPGVVVDDEELRTLAGLSGDRDLQYTIARVRDLVAPAAIDRAEGGYLLEPGAVSIDLVRFRDLVSSARIADESAPLWAEAARLWRGGPDLDLPTSTDSSAVQGVIDALREEYVVAVLGWAGAARGSRDPGRVEAVLPTLRDLAARLPLHEPVHAELIVTLAATGRQAEAIETYDAIERRLDTELGLDPSPVLIEARKGVLEQRWYTAASDPATRAAPVGIAPRQIPAPPTILLGRDAEIDRISKALGRTRLVLVTGPGGSGKSSVALAAAHRVLKAYPDGQLYADLYGSPQTPADPIDVLGRFLRALGVPAADVPLDPTELVDLVRSRVADRRLLVVLDSARSIEQVLTILGALGSSGASATLVTSRHRLPDLIAYADLVRVDLATLAPDAAADLLTTLIGDDRPRRDREATIQLAEACDRLPLALRIAAARLVARPRQEIRRFAERLVDQGRALAELTVGHTSVAAAFQLSYDVLSPEHQRAFRLCALIPGHHFSAAAAASLLDRPVPAVRDLLDDLVDANMLQPHETDPAAYASGLGAEDRYHYHDLLHLYADELRDDEAEDTASLGRVAEHYLRHATAATDLASPGNLRTHYNATDSGRLFHTPDDALAWLSSEVDAITAMITHVADDPELRSYAWRLAEQVIPYLRRSVDPRAWLDVADRALAAAVDQPLARTVLLTHRAQSLAATGHGEAGAKSFAEAKRIAETNAWPDGVAYVEARSALNSVDAAHEVQDEALRGCERGLAMTEGRTDLVGLAIRANWAYARAGIRFYRGDFRGALADITVATEAAEQMGDHERLLTYRSSVVAVRRRLGDLEGLKETLQSILRDHRGRGDREGESMALEHLAIIQLTNGDFRQAASSVMKALELSTTLDRTRTRVFLHANLGRALLGSGQLEEAETSFRTARDRARRYGVPYAEAMGEIGLARIAHLRQDADAERAHAEAALAIATDQRLDHDLVQQAREVLAQLDGG